MPFRPPVRAGNSQFACYDLQTMMTSTSAPPTPTIVATASDASHRVAGLGYLSKHRIEGLTDGIFAVAMTLLVIELKLGEHGAITTAEQLQHALVALLPKGLAWIISFFVLAFFWLGHHRLFQHVRHVDARMLWANIAMLCAASLMPFSSALVGEHAGAFVSQCFYAGNMIVLSATALAMLIIARRSPVLLTAPLSNAVFVGSRFRIVSLIAISAVAIVIASFAPAFATIVFALMPLVGHISRRLAVKAAEAELAT